MSSWISHLVITSGLLLSANACSVVHWRRFSYEELLYAFDLVVVGTDMRHVASNASGFEGFKDSEFTVSCVLKGDDQGISENITIAEVDPLNTCMVSVLYPGGDFIVGLTRYNGRYIQHSVNPAQAVAFLNTTENLNQALRVCGLQNPRPPDGFVGAHYDFCQPQNETSPCVGRSGVENNSAGILTLVVLIFKKYIF